MPRPAESYACYPPCCAMVTLSPTSVPEALCSVLPPQNLVLPISLTVIESQ